MWALISRLSPDDDDGIVVAAESTGMGRLGVTLVRRTASPRIV